MVKAVLDHLAQVLIQPMAFQRFRQSLPLLAQRALGQLRQLGGSLLGVLQERLQDTLSRNAEDIAHHLADLDVGALQQFLDAVPFAVGPPTTAVYGDGSGPAIP